MFVGKKSTSTEVGDVVDACSVGCKDFTAVGSIDGFVDDIILGLDVGK
jgi:hypothetical protein